MTKKVIMTESQIKNLIKESVIDETPESLFEMARVDNPNKDSTILGTREVWIYGNDRSSMIPHFHYFDRKGSNSFEVEIRIDDLTICHSLPRKGVSENKLLTWEGIGDAQKALKKWLLSPNSDISSINNYTMLKITWNQNNRSNQVEVLLTIN